MPLVSWTQLSLGWDGRQPTRATHTRACKMIDTTLIACLHQCTLCIVCAVKMEAIVDEVVVSDADGAAMLAAAATRSAKLVERGTASSLHVMVAYISGFAFNSATGSKQRPIALRYMQQLLNNGADPNALAATTYGKSVSVIDAAIDHVGNFDVELVNMLLWAGGREGPSGRNLIWTAIDSASNRAHPELLELVLTSGTRRDARIKDFHRRVIADPVHSTTLLSRNPSVALQLLRAGAVDPHHLGIAPSRAEEVLRASRQAAWEARLHALRMHQHHWAPYSRKADQCNGESST